MGKLKKLLGFEEDFYDEQSENYDIENSNFDEANKSTFNSTICLTKATRFEDVLTICDKVQQGKIVLLSLSSVTDGSSRRIVDFLSGFCYTIDAEINCVEGVYTLIPYNVEITDELPLKSVLNF